MSILSIMIFMHGQTYGLVKTSVVDYLVDREILHPVVFNFLTALRPHFEQIKFHFVSKGAM